MELSQNAWRVLEACYLRRNTAGEISETPDQLFARVARAVAHAELLLGSAEQSAQWEERFHHLLEDLDFPPNLPTPMNAGTPLGQLSACFVLPAEASPDVIGAVYREAHQLGLKGITVYRYGNIASQVLQLGVGEEPFEREHASKCDPNQCKL